MARISSQPLRGFRSGSADERKKRESSEKSVQAAKTLPDPHAVFRTFFLSVVSTILDPGTCLILGLEPGI